MDPRSAPAAPVAVVVKELSPAETLGLVAEDVHVAQAPPPAVGPCWKRPAGCVCCPQWPCWKASLCALCITAVVVVAVLALLILFVVEVLQSQPELMG